MVIKSKCGKHDIIIDDEDYHMLNEFGYNGWEARYFTGNNIPYAVTRKTVIINGQKKRKSFLIHRVIMNVTDPNIHVDHISRNPLDNRKSNLRLVNRHQNMKNRTKKKTSKSKYLGVSYVKPNKYRVYIQPNPIIGNIHLGYYDEDEKAGYAYNIAAEILHGEYANLNDVNINSLEIREKVLKHIEKKYERSIV
jgi:hypothetical protein